MLRVKAVSFLALATSITYGGFYAFMSLFLIATGSISGTRILTMPLRMIILVALCIGYIGLRRRKGPRLTNLFDLAFVIFCALYTLRIFIELFPDSAQPELHRAPIEILFFFASFVAFPFFLVSRLNLSAIELDKLMNYTLLGLFFFSILSTIAHRDYIQTGLRYAIVFGAENVMSPLFLSYTGSLGIGLGVAAVLRERQLNFWAIVGVITIIVSLLPFFMGASRGSIIALALPILFLVVATQGRLAIIASIASGLMVLAMIFASNYLGNGVFARFLSIREDIASEASEASRIFLWRSSIQQFRESPILGSSLENLAFNYYPHNIFLEVMMSTGMLGLTPFLILIFIAFQRCFLILKYGSRHYWVVVLFLQSLSQSLFSGALYSAAWLALSLALVAVTWRSLNLCRLRRSQRPIRVATAGKIRRSAI